MLASVIWNVDPVAFSIGSLSVRWYGILWAVGIYICYLIEVKLYKNEQCPPDWTDKLFVYMVLGVIIGARLGHCWFYEWHEASALGLEPIQIFSWTIKYRNPYIEHPFELLKIWQGGLSSHGGAFGLIFAAWLLSKRHFHTGLVWIFDRLVIGVCITATCIRLGNLLNSEIYGNPTTMPWGFVFMRDPAVPLDAEENPLPCHPTQIYEILYCMVAFVVTWLLYWKAKAYKRNGLIFGVFLEIIFVTRFFLEFIKLDQETFESSMTLNMGQWLSLPFIIWGVYLIVMSVRKPQISSQNTSTRQHLSNGKHA